MSHSADKAIGNQLRFFRQMAGISQQELAKQLGVTFQQVQKYEHGKNRISAGTLYEAARFLHVPLTDFFETGACERSPVTLTRETRLLLKYFTTLEKPTHRSAVVGLVKGLAES